MCGISIRLISGCYNSINPSEEKQVEFILVSSESRGLYSSSASCAQICPYCKSQVPFQATTCVSCKKDFIWPEKIDKDCIKKEMENYTTCMMNISTINTALTMYCSDNQGTYPDSLYKLTPAYLKKLPVCPNGNTNYAYNAKNVPRESFGEDSTDRRDYTIYCKGTNHKFFLWTEDRPKYNYLNESFVDQ